MRDIGNRIRRYRLSRYAAPEERPIRRFRWAYPLLGLWLLYVGVLSEHSMLRIWQMSRENARATNQLASLKAEVERLDHDLRDPAAKRSRAEHVLRERVRYAKPGEIIYTIESDVPDSLAHRER
jgi:cell division protein FtsB